MVIADADERPGAKVCLDNAVDAPLCMAISVHMTLAILQNPDQPGTHMAIARQGRRDISHAAKIVPRSGAQRRRGCELATRPLTYQIDGSRRIAGAYMDTPSTRT